LAPVIEASSLNRRHPCSSCAMARTPFGLPSVPPATPAAANAACGHATEPSSSAPPAAGVEAPPVIKTEPTRVAAIKLEHLEADTVHRRRVAVAMHRRFHPAAAATSCGVSGGDGTGDGGGAHCGVVTGTKKPAAVDGAGAVTAMDTSGASADGGGVRGGGEDTAVEEQVEVELAIPGFRFFAPAQVAEVVAKMACVGMEPHRQVALTRAIFLSADQDDITGQLVLDAPAEDVMAALLSTSRRTCRGNIPLGTRVRVLRFLRAMR